MLTSAAEYVANGSNGIRQICYQHEREHCVITALVLFAPYSYISDLEDGYITSGGCPDCR